MDYFNTKSNNFIHPFDNSINLIDLLHSLYRRLGVKNIPLSKNTDKISKLIPYSNKYVFILIDGMGYNLLKKTFSNSFLLDNTLLSMNTIFPTSTGTVLTSVATATLPEKHSINGWFSYSKKYDESIITLPFINRFHTNEPLRTPFNEVFFAEQIFKQIPLKTNAIFQKSLVGSAFSRWSIANSDLYPYSDINNAFSILEDLINQDEASFTYLYAGEYDSICHKYGSESNEAKNLLQSINNIIENYSKKSINKCTTIIVADHGQIIIKPENFYVLKPNDEMCKYFYAPPGGDARFTSFYIDENYQKEFIEEFNFRFDDKAVLLSINQVEEIGLLGGGVLSDVCRERFGNYLAIWDEGYAFKYSAETITSGNLDVGNHGGLSRDELEVPLIIF